MTSDQQTSIPAVHSPELGAIRAAFPTLEWTSATRVEEGWDHVVILCHGCSGEDSLGHPELVFRFPSDEQAFEQLPLEIAVLEHLAGRVEAALPRYTHVPEGAWFAGYPLVRGDRLTPDFVNAMPATERTVLATQLGGLLSALHITDLTEHPLDLVPDSFQTENLDFIRGIVENNLPDVFTPEEMRTVHQICDEVSALQSRPLPTVFLHYDIYDRHLYWDSATAPGRLGLIDFTDMCLGDPAVDFAELYAYGPRFVEDVLARYVGHVDATFLDRAWTYQRLAGLYTLAGHLYYGVETWEYARSTFDRCRDTRRPRA